METKHTARDLATDPTQFHRWSDEGFPHIAGVDDRRFEPPLPIEHIAVHDGDAASVDISAWTNRWMIGINLSLWENQTVTIEWKM